MLMKRYVAAVAIVKRSVPSAIEIDPKTKVAKVNEAVCKGCGACAVNCPSKAMQLKNFTPKQIIDMINVATEEYAGVAA